MFSLTIYHQRNLICKIVLYFRNQFLYGKRQCRNTKSISFFPFLSPFLSLCPRIIRPLIPLGFLRRELTVKGLTFSLPFVLRFIQDEKFTFSLNSAKNTFLTPTFTNCSVSMLLEFFQLSVTERLCDDRFPKP